MSSNSPSGGMKEIVRSLSNLWHENIREINTNTIKYNTNANIIIVALAPESFEAKF